MDGNTLRTIADNVRERQRISGIKERADTFALCYRAAQKVMGYIEYSDRVKVDGNWLEFYAPFLDIMSMRGLKVWGLARRGYQKESVLKLFTGRMLIVEANSVDWARIRVRYR